MFVPMLSCLAMALNLSCERPEDPLEPLVLDAPNGSATYYVGDTLEIRWRLNDSIAGLQIDFSANNGASYAKINAFFPNDPEIADNRCHWIIPDSVGIPPNRSTVSDSCKIWIHDYFDYTIGDASDRVFSIKRR
jgi:hypothetical protein